LTVYIVEIELANQMHRVLIDTVGGHTSNERGRSVKEGKQRNKEK